MKRADWIKEVYSRISTKIEITLDGCWEYRGTRNDKGYGKITSRGKQLLVHRISWEYHHNREIGAGLFICHQCDNRCCLNPSHLFEGTQADNMKDAFLKGRIVVPGQGKTHCIHGHPFNEENTRFKFTHKPNTPIRRECKTCDKERAREQRRKRKQM